MKAKAILFLGEPAWSSCLPSYHVMRMWELEPFVSSQTVLPKWWPTRTRPAPVGLQSALEEQILSAQTHYLECGEDTGQQVLARIRELAGHHPLQSNTYLPCTCFGPGTTQSTVVPPRLWGSWPRRQTPSRDKKLCDSTSQHYGNDG